MKKTSNARAHIVIFLAILLLSASTMVWLFWHHPLTTSIATLAVLTLLGVSARLARSIEAEAEQDSDEPPGVGALDAGRTISR